MKTLKVRIFGKNEGFVNEIINFLMSRTSEFSKTIKRDKLIKEILSIDKKLQKEDLSIYILRNLSPIKIETNNSFSVCGKNYESSREDILNIGKISHNLHHIILNDKDEFYGIIQILDTQYGRPLKSLEEEDIILKPIYNHNKEIVRFDIDFNINKSA
jgi:hypothetical protein